MAASWCSLPPSTTWPTISRAHLVRAFIEQTARYLGGWTRDRPACTVGSFEELRDSKEKGAAVDVVDPKGDRVLSLAEATKAQNVQFTQAGFYDIRRPNGRNELVAVNADRRESDLTPASPETLTLWQNTASGSARDGRAGAKRAKAAFAVVVCNAGGVGVGSGRIIVGKSTSLGGQRGGMKPFDRLSEYLGAIERRLRWIALTRGAAVTAGAALAADGAGRSGGQQVCLFQPQRDGRARVPVSGSGVGDCRRADRAGDPPQSPPRRAPGREPSIRNSKNACLRSPSVGEESATIRFCTLLADDALTMAQQAQPHEVAKSAWMFSFSSAAVAVGAGADVAGSFRPRLPGLRHVAAVGRAAQGQHQAVLFHQSGSRKPHHPQTRRPGDHGATCRASPRPKSASSPNMPAPRSGKQAEMRTEPGGSAYQFMIAGVPESLEYYVEAGGVRSQSYKLNVMDLPSVKKIRGHLSLSRLERPAGRHGRSGRRPACRGRHDRRS